MKNTKIRKKKQEQAEDTKALKDLGVVNWDKAKVLAYIYLLDIPIFNRSTLSTSGV